MIDTSTEFSKLETLRAEIYHLGNALNYANSSYNNILNTLVEVSHGQDSYDIDEDDDSLADEDDGDVIEELSEVELQELHYTGQITGFIGRLKHLNRN
jgi:hypothetical protein